tara:strand:- start:1432 stop:1959 length:528 start_codon:yes stop_codon:yes gene_type:complete
MYWLIFDKDTSKVIGLQNYSPDNKYALEVNEDLYVDFIENPDKKDNYVVKFDLSKKEYKLLEYEQPKFNYDIKDVIYHVPKEHKADCMITRSIEWRNWKLNVNVKEKLLLNPNQVCKFSITKENDPHLLIRTFSATVEQIAKGHMVQFEHNEEEGDVSVYTPKIFNTYGFIDETI